MTPRVFRAIKRALGKTPGTASRLGTRLLAEQVLWRLYIAAFYLLSLWVVVPITETFRYAGMGYGAAVSQDYGSVVVRCVNGLMDLLEQRKTGVILGITGGVIVCAIGIFAVNWLALGALSRRRLVYLRGLMDTGQQDVEKDALKVRVISASLARAHAGLQMVWLVAAAGWITGCYFLVPVHPGHDNPDTNRQFLLFCGLCWCVASLIHATGVFVVDFLVAPVMVIHGETFVASLKRIAGVLTPGRVFKLVLWTTIARSVSLFVLVALVVLVGFCTTNQDNLGMTMLLLLPTLGARLLFPVDLFEQIGSMYIMQELSPKWVMIPDGIESGRCRACGYDLRGGPGDCPECGAA